MYSMCPAADGRAGFLAKTEHGEYQLCYKMRVAQPAMGPRIPVPPQARRGPDPPAAP